MRLPGGQGQTRRANPRARAWGGGTRKPWLGRRWPCEGRGSQKSERVWSELRNGSRGATRGWQALPRPGKSRPLPPLPWSSPGVPALPSPHVSRPPVRLSPQGWAWGVWQAPGSILPGAQPRWARLKTLRRGWLESRSSGGSKRGGEAERGPGGQRCLLHRGPGAGLVHLPGRVHSGEQSQKGEGGWVWSGRPDQGLGFSCRAAGSLGGSEQEGPGKRRYPRRSLRGAWESVQGPEVLHRLFLPHLSALRRGHPSMASQCPGS